MLILPNEDPLNGLIHNSFVSGITFASSTNFNENRKDCPINHSSTDRWCSGETGQKTPQYWGINLSKYVRLMYYTLKNPDNVRIISFIVEGRLKNSKWRVISAVDSFGKEINEARTLKTNNTGPFTSIRITSIENPYDGYGYYFCIQKVEFFGSAFSVLRISCKVRKLLESFIRYCLLKILLCV